MFVHTVCVCSVHRGQMRVSEPLDWCFRQLGAATWVLGLHLGPLEEQLDPPSHVQFLHIFLRKESQGCVERSQLWKATFREQLVFPDRTCRASVELTSVLRNRQHEELRLGQLPVTRHRKGELRSVRFVPKAKESHMPQPTTKDTKARV